MDDPTRPPLDSDKSTDIRTSNESTTENIHEILHTGSSVTSSHTNQPGISHGPGSLQTGTENIPNTPSQNPVQSTSTYRHYSDQHTPITTSEHRIVHTHGQGPNPIRPLKDESTQMPSQEALMIANNQGTQFPSQQWEQTPNSKDQEETQHKTNTPERAARNTSFQRIGVSGTYLGSPTVPSLAEKHTANVVKSPTLTDYRPTGTRDNKTPNTNQSKESKDPTPVEPKHLRNDNSESNKTMDLNVHNEDHTTSIPVTVRAQSKPVDTKGYPRTNSPQPQESRHTSQTDHGHTNLGNTEHPTPVHTGVAESQKLDNTSTETGNTENTLLQRLCSGQNTSGTEEPGSSKGTHSPITKVTDKTNSEITPITITISEGSSDDGAQVSAPPYRENRPNQSPQEITLSSSGDSSEESDNVNKQEIWLSAKLGVNPEVWS